MLASGQLVKSDSGKTIKAQELIKAGGQGQAYRAVEMNSGEKGVLKIFHSILATHETLKRSQFLISLKLNQASPLFRAPVELINESGLMAHYAPLAPGQTLEDLLEGPIFPLREGIQLGIAICQGLEILHARRIAHGDVQSGNLFVHRSGTVFEAFLIDLDNFNAQGVPAPPSVGHDLYMAPELREALAQKKPAIPDIQAELFSLGVVMHEVILQFHPAAGADDEASFHQSMCSGKWVHDPENGWKHHLVGGYPPQVLNPHLMGLLRRSFSMDRAARPAAGEWRGALREALDQVDLCTSCGIQSLTDLSRFPCPFCGFMDHSMRIILSSGKVIPLHDGETMVGRKDLGGSMYVSSQHAVFRSIGAQTYCESIGKNGTYRLAGSRWRRLPDGKPVPVQKGDRLRLADVDALIG